MDHRPLPPQAPLGKRIVFAGKALRARLEEALAANGASLPTFFVLTSARESSGLSQTELAGRVGIESPTLVRHLDRLSAEGLVVREAVQGTHESPALHTHPSRALGLR